MSKWAQRGQDTARQVMAPAALAGLVALAGCFGGAPTGPDAAASPAAGSKKAPARAPSSSPAEDGAPAAAASPSEPTVSAPPSAPPSASAPASSSPLPSASPPLVASSPLPSPSRPPAPPLEAAYSDPGYQVYGGSLSVDVRAADQPVAGAVVRVYGPRLGIAGTDGQGRAKLGPLDAGTSYQVVVEAPGHGTYASGALEVQKDAITSVRVDLRPEAVAIGTVKAGGAPVVGAVVSDGRNSTLTDGQGRYVLPGVAPGSVTITASKPRFAPGAATSSAIAGTPVAVDFALTAGDPAVFFDGGPAPGVPATRLAALRAHLGTRGWRVADQPPPADGVWVLASPTRDLTAPELDRLAAFVAQGGKLVILGEWGGEGAFRTPAANGLAHRFGLHLNSDLVREPSAAADPAWLAVTRFAAGHPAVDGATAIQLYASSSVFGLPPMATLAETGPTGFRLQAAPVAGSQALVAGGPHQGGKVVVVGDATAFTDDDADGDGTANVAEAGNLAFVERIFSW